MVAESLHSTETEQDKSPPTRRWQAKALRRPKPRLRPPSMMRPQLLDLRARRALSIPGLLLQVRLEMKVIVWTITETRTLMPFLVILDIRVLV